jgi:hypothetical protein
MIDSSGNFYETLVARLKHNSSSRTERKTLSHVYTPFFTTRAPLADGGKNYVKSKLGHTSSLPLYLASM